MRNVSIHAPVRVRPRTIADMREGDVSIHAPVRVRRYDMETGTVYDYKFQFTHP